MAKKLTKPELVELISNQFHPMERELTSEQLNQQLLLFCINCPDPVAAMALVVEGPSPSTAEELVERAISYPKRDVASVPTTELPPTHPLRSMKLDE